jgi:hypothetical protein
LSWGEARTNSRKRSRQSYESSVEDPSRIGRKESERDWHSSPDAANIPHYREMAAPNNCCLAIDRRSVCYD